MKPYAISTIQGSITVSGPSLKEPRAFFIIADAKQFAEFLNDAYRAGYDRCRKDTDQA